MKKFFILLPTLLILILSCSQEPQFTIEGVIQQGADKTIYLYHHGVNDAILLDSAKLDQKGAFIIKSGAPESPDFYRLKMDNKVIYLSIDSIETVQLTATYDHFSTDYTVQGSPTSLKIKELVLKQMEFQKQATVLYNQAKEGKIDPKSFEEQFSILHEAYKEMVKRDYIYQNPKETPAYFALFQTVNGYPIFDPTKKKDLACYQAVATSLNQYYPNAVRSKNLYNITMKGLSNARKKARGEREIVIDRSKIEETGLIDIALNDRNGVTHKLTDLKGKVVLLDFIAYQGTEAPTHNLLLRSLYTKYKEQGLEIYQLSLDVDEHFWKTSASNLPWICVRDENGIYSRNLTLYNIQNLPTIFLIDKEGNLKSRLVSEEGLEKQLKALL